MKNIFYVLITLSLTLLLVACGESTKIPSAEENEIVTTIDAKKGSEKSFADVKDLIASILDYNNKEYENVVVKYKGDDYVSIDDLNLLLTLLKEDSSYSILADSSEDQLITLVVTIIDEENVEDLIEQNDIGDDVIFESESEL